MLISDLRYVEVVFNSSSIVGGQTTVATKSSSAATGTDDLVTEVKSISSVSPSPTPTASKPINVEQIIATEIKLLPVNISF